MTGSGGNRDGDRDRLGGALADVLRGVGRERAPRVALGSPTASRGGGILGEILGGRRAGASGPAGGGAGGEWSGGQGDGDGSGGEPPDRGGTGGGWNQGGAGRRPGSGFSPKLLIALVVAAASLYMYWQKQQVNPVTGERQFVELNVEQEIALGIQSAPEMAAQHGGIDRDPAMRARVELIGQRLVDAVRQTVEANGRALPYQFQFHALADGRVVNAFALPGGQVFLTRALYDRLQTEGQLAGVLGHEIGHVIARHSAQRIAKEKLAQGMTAAAVIGAVDDLRDPNSWKKAGAAILISKVVTMKFGRDDEIESDLYAVDFLPLAGYDPRAMIQVMEILAQAGAGGGGMPEFFSTHPDPGNRAQRIEEAIRRKYPNGLPSGLIP